MLCFRKVIVTFHKINWNLEKSIENFQGRFFYAAQNKIGPGYFWYWALWDQAGGVGEIPLPPLNTENIKAMITKLKGNLERLKLFPLRSATSADSVI